MPQLNIDISRPLDVIPMGRIAIDFNPVDYFMPLSQSTTFKKYVGGSPANIAVGLARLGNKVGFIGTVSDDAFGDYVSDYFEKEGIDISHVTRANKGEKLGLTFTEILSPTKSSILMYREGVADLALHPCQVDESYIARAKMLLISGTALSKSPSREACLKALTYAQNHQTVVVFDIDYRPYTWQNDDEIALYYQMVAEKADIIIGSREEFDLTEKLLTLDGSDKASKDHWLNQKAEIVIIKHGKEGSTAYTKNGDYQVNIFPVDALKGFGGGDGYGSAFLHGLLLGYPIEKALEFGSASAAMLIASHACSQDMPSHKDIETFISEKKPTSGDIVTKK